MIEKVENNQIQSILDKSPSGPPKNAPKPPAKHAEISIQVDYVSFIDAAMKIPKDDAHAVQRAKKMLAAGQLESPEYLRKAAQNMIIFGI
jgi:hypothetical protein